VFGAKLIEIPISSAPVCENRRVVLRDIHVSLKQRLCDLINCQAKPPEYRERPSQEAVALNAAKTNVLGDAAIEVENQTFCEGEGW
jgi:hypothetical protein